MNQPPPPLACLVLLGLSLLAGCRTPAPPAASAPPPQVKAPPTQAGKPPAAAPSLEEELLLSDDDAARILRAMQEYRSPASGQAPGQASVPTALSRAAATIRPGVTTKRYLVSQLGLRYEKGANAAGQATAVWTQQRSLPAVSRPTPRPAQLCEQRLTVAFDDRNLVVAHDFQETRSEPAAAEPAPGS